MPAFIQLLLNELRQSLVQALAVLLIALGVVIFLYRRHKARHSDLPFPWKKTALILLLAAYLAVLSYATLQRLGGMGASGVNLHPFHAWREAWNHFSLTAWLNVLLNVALFVPLGILLPMIRKGFRKWQQMLAAGGGLSLWIELMQLAGGRGIFDIDDLSANTLGAMLGFWLIGIVLCLREKRWGSAIRHGILTLVPLAAVCGLFLIYAAQPYGNLPDAPTYRTNTRGITWILSCELPDTEPTLPIYALDLPTQAESDALRDTFAQILGVEFERTDHYDESTMYMDQMGTPSQAHFLTVQRLDGTWEYFGIYDNRTPAQTDRAAIEALLAQFGISVPAEAEFTYLHSGIHQFSVDRLTIGDTMIDGTLTCTYNTEGLLSEISNRLITYTYSGEADVISPQEACERLQSGEFTSYWFRQAAPDPVTVRSCTLAYRVDTKGFCQPVYLFEIAAGNSEYAETILIPALE